MKKKMKESMGKMVAIAMLAVMSLSFLACSEKFEGPNCYYAFGFEKFSESAYNEEDRAKIKAYQTTVYNAYISALGMTDKENTLLIDGDLKTNNEIMVAKCKAVEASLPEAPALSNNAKYSFTLFLSSCDLAKNSKQETIYSKTFSN